MTIINLHHSCFVHCLKLSGTIFCCVCIFYNSLRHRKMPLPIPITSGLTKWHHKKNIKRKKKVCAVIIVYTKILPTMFSMQTLSFAMPALLQIALCKIFRCAENHTQDHFSRVMVCYHTLMPQKTRPTMQKLETAKDVPYSFQYPLMPL